MIPHNLPGFLAGPMPVPGWPKDPNILTFSGSSGEKGKVWYQWFRSIDVGFGIKGSSLVLTPKKRYRGRNAKSKR